VTIPGLQRITPLRFVLRTARETSKLARFSDWKPVGNALGDKMLPFGRGLLN
jgi:hypothetical protein